MPLLPPPILRLKYAKAANQYERNLTLEDIMESTPHATQREITVASLALVRAQRSDFHLFNELLIQYPLSDESDDVGQVVPDNMVVIHDGPLTPDKSYDIPFEPARPFWVMEYISKSSELKDFEISFKKYEEYLKVPYYLLFYPENQELTLFRLGDTKYVSVKPNRKGRCAIPELDLEVAIHNGWCRYWYQNKLLPLPADLLHHVESLERKLAAERKHRRAEAKRAEQEAKRAEQEKRLRLNSEEELRMLRAELEQLKGRQS